MDWQTPVAAAIALLCGVWTVRRAVRAFRVDAGSPCQLCDECGKVNPLGELLRIAPLPGGGD